MIVIVVTMLFVIAVIRDEIFAIDRSQMLDEPFPDFVFAWALCR